MFEDVFKHKRLVYERLLPYGFADSGDGFIYSTDVLNGEFSLTVRLSKSGDIDTDLTEKETGEPYTLYKTNASGAFVGDVRKQIESVLSDIVAHCCDTAIFKSEQAQMLIDHVRLKYKDEPEFLWSKFPDNAVWRRKDNNKWYGAILTTAGNKVGVDTEKPVEIVDLRMAKSEAEAVLARKNYYPGWHMNKKSWFTIVLNGSVPDDEIKQMLDKSYDLALNG